ncbi:MAG: hypothetical protein J6B26_03895 [Agathobacter sp.]|nr:hypothetical protein [Agathobacter sp.]
MRKGMSMRKRGQKTPKAFLVIFAIAILAAILVWVALPVPGQWKRLIGFMIIPVVSIAGVLGYNFISRRK